MILMNNINEQLDPYNVRETDKYMTIHEQCTVNVRTVKGLYTDKQ